MAGSLLRLQETMLEVITKEVIYTLWDKRFLDWAFVGFTGASGDYATTNTVPVSIIVNPVILDIFNHHRLYIISVAITQWVGLACPHSGQSERPKLLQAGLLRLMDPTYRPSSIVSGSTGTGALPFAGSDLVLSPTQWSSHVVDDHDDDDYWLVKGSSTHLVMENGPKWCNIRFLTTKYTPVICNFPNQKASLVLLTLPFTVNRGKISSWIDLDSDDEMLRQDSEIALKQEIGWASHLSLQACLLPAPKGAACGNYARCVNQILQNLSNMQLWLRIPLEKSDDDTTDENMAGGEVDSWELWNSFRHLCESHSQLSIAFDISCSLPSANSLGRWFGESVRAAILHTSSFLTNARGYPCLSKCHQKLLTRFFDHSIQTGIDIKEVFGLNCLVYVNIVVSGKPADNHPMGTLELGAKSTDNHVEGIQRHPLRSYLDYVGYLYQKMDPLPEQERFELAYRDFLQSPLQPLMDNLEAQTYETFEKDTVKYIQYQRAISKALLDRIPDEQASTVTTVLMVVGAGRGPLVRASLQAAEETGRKLKVYAVEKNPNAVVTLHSLVKLECWENMVTIVSSDMRCWDAPEKADILVSELLGSFGDNELSPECLDGAQRFLKQDGISIPSSY
ncbi:hypothetical protein RJ639_011739, partial [Escallonia herrerae]